MRNMHQGHATSEHMQTSLKMGGPHTHNAGGKTVGISSIASAMKDVGGASRINGSTVTAQQMTS